MSTFLDILLFVVAECTTVQCLRILRICLQHNGAVLNCLVPGLELDKALSEVKMKGLFHIGNSLFLLRGKVKELAAMNESLFLGVIGRKMMKKMMMNKDSIAIENIHKIEQHWCNSYLWINPCLLFYWPPHAPFAENTVVWHLPLYPRYNEWSEKMITFIVFHSF